MDGAEKNLESDDSWRLWLPLFCLAVLLATDLALLWLARMGVSPGPYSGLTLATVFSAVQLGAIGLLAIVNGVGAGKKDRFAWLGLAAFFFFLVLDELAEIHESLSMALASLLGAGDKTHAEIIILAVYISIGGLIVRALLRELGRDRFSRVMSILAAAVLALWLVGNSAPPPAFRWPETGFKLMTFSLITAILLRRLLLNKPATD